MAGKKTEGRIVVPDASVTTMANKFSKYKPEEEKAVRKVEVVEDEMLKKIKEAWKAFQYNSNEMPEIAYDKAAALAEPLRCSTSDVEKFSIALVQFQDENGFSRKAGLFLSALINNGKDQDYVIHTRHLTVPIIDIGERNTKNLVIDGDIRYGVGERMKSGKIILKGNTWDNVGSDMEGGEIIVEGDAAAAADGTGPYMKGGSILVKGDAGWSVGYGMTGGTIRIEGDLISEKDMVNGVGIKMEGGSITIGGNAGELVGRQMKGGEIHLDGDYMSIAEDIEHGKIFHKGKLIVDK